MSGIIEFFTGLADIISTLVNFVVNIFKDFVYILKLIYTTMVNITLYFQWLPTTIITLLGTALSVVIIYKVIGRD